MTTKMKCGHLPARIFRFLEKTLRMVSRSSNWGLTIVRSTPQSNLQRRRQSMLQLFRQEAQGDSGGREGRAGLHPHRAAGRDHHHRHPRRHRHPDLPRPEGEGRERRAAEPTRGTPPRLPRSCAAATTAATRPATRAHLDRRTATTRPTCDLDDCRRRHDWATTTMHTDDGTTSTSSTRATPGGSV